MNSHAFRRWLLGLLLQWAEAVMVWLAFGAAGWVARGMAHMPVSAIEALTEHAALCLGLMVVWHEVLQSRGLYASHRLENGRQELLQSAAAVAVMVGLVAVAVIAFSPELASIEFLAAFATTLCTMLVAERALLRRLLWHIRGYGRNLRSALIVGSGERAQRVARVLASRPQLGYRILGCVDDVPPAAPALGPWLGPLSSLSKVLSECVVDEVLIALPLKSSYERIQQAVSKCEEQGALVTMPTDFFAARLARTRVGEVASQPALFLSAVPQGEWRLWCKQTIDFVGSLSLVVLLAPLLGALALAIRFTSPGPAIFRQTRIGLNKRPFTLFKFRTMVADAERRQAALESANEASGPVFKIREDPRVTPLGRFLRRSSLDELPQLFNVLRGDMSLVGPRPLPQRDVAGFREDWHRRRFSVLPGITCLWQLSGRSDLSFEQWMELDLEYIDRWSLALDLGILLKTARVVLSRQGAY